MAVDPEPTLSEPDSETLGAFAVERSVAPAVMAACSTRLGSFETSVSAEANAVPSSALATIVASAVMLRRTTFKVSDPLCSLEVLLCHILGACQE